MLKPKYLDRLPDHMVELYSQAEMDILADMAKRISAFNDFIPSAQWQYRKLIEMGNYHSFILQTLSSMTGKTSAELKRLMEEAGAKTLAFDDAVYRKSGLSPPPLAASTALHNVLTVGLEKTHGLFKNLTSTTASTATKQFEDALDQAYMQMTSGAFSRTEAITSAIKSLTGKGVASIRYPSGHVDYMDVAVRRAVLTGVNQTTLKLQNARADEMGCDLVETSAHAGARPSHAEWQGKIFSRGGQDSKYPDFVSSTGYGTGNGLGGWNCRHSFYPYFEGLSEPGYTRAELAEMKAPSYEYDGQKLTEYEATQTQRKIERNIRRWKREYKAMEAAGLPTDEAASKLSRWQATQKDFLEKTGLKRQVDRESVVGFGRNEASKSIWSVRKTNNPSLFPQDAFSQNVQANKISDVSYEDALKHRFKTGTDTGKKVYAKYVPKRSVSNGKYTGVAHYSPLTKRISMNFADDAVNARGIGATYFHEHGHLVDFSGGTPVSKSLKFHRALQNDFDNYIIQYMGDNTISDLAMAHAAVSADLRKSDMLSAVSDIMGGLSGNVVKGNWGHRLAYWANDPDNITAESFAHLFEAQFCPERLRLFKKYFPTATEEFNKIMEGLI